MSPKHLFIQYGEIIPAAQGCPNNGALTSIGRHWDSVHLAEQRACFLVSQSLNQRSELKTDKPVSLSQSHPAL